MTTLAYHPADTTTGFRRLVHAILGTDASSTTLFLRLVLGAVMLPHGLQKAFGLFGGYGFAGTIGGFSSMGIPVFLSVLVILAETLGAVALIAGFATRIAAFGIGATLAVAAIMVHRAHFFMNWSGTQGGEGFEYHLLGVAIAAVLVTRGAGRASLDRRFTRN
jgi:putative oxidoreductase